MRTVTAASGTFYELSTRHVSVSEQILMEIMDEAYERLSPWQRFRASVFLAWVVLKLDIAEWWRRRA